MSGAAVAQDDLISHVPPLNKTVVQDLDRSLRETLDLIEKDLGGRSSASSSATRDISGSIHAVERASSFIKSVSNRVGELEGLLRAAEARCHLLAKEKGDLTARCKLLGEKLAMETERANMAETLNKEHEAYSTAVAEDLARANADIERLTDVIARAFGSMNVTD